MDEVRSAAAMAGHIDVERLIDEAAEAMRRAKSQTELHVAYETFVKPVSSQIGGKMLRVLGCIHDIKLALLICQGIGQ